MSLLIGRIPRDNNRTPVLGALSSADGVTLVPLEADPNTNRLLVDAAITLPGTSAMNLTQVGGATIALGQTTMSASLPVTLASNQSTLPVNMTQLNGVAASAGTGASDTGTQRIVLTNDYLSTASSKITDGTNNVNVLKSDGTAVGQNSILAANAYLSVPFTTTTVQAVGTTDVGNYRSVSIQFTSQGGSSVATFQVSDDNTNWKSAILYFSDSVSANGTTNTSSVAVLTGPLMGRYFRINVTGIASGTTAGTIVFSAFPGTLHTISAQQGGTWTVGANSATGSAIPANAFSMGGSDGTNLRALSVSTAGVLDTGLAPARTSLNAFSIHLTSNTTTTPTSSTAYISSISISSEVAGTTSTVTIQDKQGTPLKLVNGFSTTTLTTAPTVVNFQTPVKMVSGIDIITAGAVAATIDVWVNYYQ